MLQVLQKRHLIDKPVEYLVKYIEKRNNRIKEIWKTEKDLVENSSGKSLLLRFQETKVGERGIDLYIGKRRSLNIKNVEQNKKKLEGGKKIKERKSRHNEEVTSLDKYFINIFEYFILISQFFIQDI